MMFSYEYSQCELRKTSAGYICPPCLTVYPPLVSCLGLETEHDGKRKERLKYAQLHKLKVHMVAVMFGNSRAPTLTVPGGCQLVHKSAVSDTAVSPKVAQLKALTTEEGPSGIYG